MCHTPSAYPWNATRRLSGAQAGWRASRNSSVTRFAGPPLAGSDHKLPCRSIISVRPSGDSAAAMFVPSRRLSEIGLVAGALCGTNASAPRGGEVVVFLTTGKLLQGGLTGSGRLWHHPPTKTALLDENRALLSRDSRCRA